MCDFRIKIGGHKTRNKLNEINKENQSEEARGFVTLNNIFTFWLYDSTRLFQTTPKPYFSLYADGAPSHTAQISDGVKNQKGKN